MDTKLQHELNTLFAEYCTELTQAIEPGIKIEKTHLSSLLEGFQCHKERLIECARRSDSDAFLVRIETTSAPLIDRACDLVAGWYQHHASRRLEMPTQQASCKSDLAYALRLFRNAHQNTFAQEQVITLLERIAVQLEHGITCFEP